MAKAWIRRLTVEFTSKKTNKKLVFGESWKNGKEDLNISVSIHKYASPLKDSATIEISNLSYTEIVYLINGAFYDVEVKYGYKDSSVFTVFKGGVTYISNNLINRKENKVIVLCGSELIAKFGQSRINLSINSGVNLYTALKVVSKKAGILNSNISNQLKATFVKEISTTNNAASWIDQLAKSNQNIMVNSDASGTATFSIYNVMRGGGRKIKLDNDKIILRGSYPRLTKDGVTITMLPTFNFMPGDTIVIDNSILDISTSSNSSSNFNKGYYLDDNGEYVVFEIEYELANRDVYACNCRLICKSRKMLSYIGGTNG